MYRRRSQCCPGYFESGDLCVRECTFFLIPKSLLTTFQVVSAGDFKKIKY